MSCCSSQKKPQEEQKTSSSCCSPSNDVSHSSQGGGCCSAPTPVQKPTKVSRSMTIKTILDLFPFKAPRIAQELSNAGLNCGGCRSADRETLEEGMIAHGKDPALIDPLVDRLNAILEEKMDLTKITLTPRAAAKFSEILAEENKQGWGLRFSEESAGCKGFEYVLDFSEKSNENDRTFESNGIQIHVNEKSLPRLIGSEIDYVEGLKGAGFKISNPNVSSNCGCGNSHSYK